MSRIGSLSGLGLSQLKALNRLQQISKSIDQSTTRLSTLKRINSAKDDPAGLVRVSILNSELAASEAASSSIDQANSMLDTASASGEEILSQLQEARSLALEAASGSLSNSEKSANQLQIDNILSSIKTQSSSSYNNKRLLDGSSSYTASGYNKTQIKDVDVYSKTGSDDLDVAINVTTTALQATDSYTGGALGADARLLIEGMDGSATISLNSGATTQEITDAFNAVSYETGITATRVDANNITFASTDYGSDAIIKISALEGTFTTTGSGSTAGRDAVATINGSSYTAQGTHFEVYSSEANYSIDIANSASGSLTGFTISGEGLEFKIGATSSSFARLGMPNFSTWSLGGSQGDLDSIGTGGANSLISGNSMSAISVIDDAISEVTKGLAIVGSFQKYTLDSSSRVLSKHQESLNKTISDIQDTNIALETSLLTNHQLLQQTTLEALSIANSSNSDVLGLLQRVSLGV